MNKIFLLLFLLLSACVTETETRVNVGEAVDDNIQLAMAYLSENQFALAQEKLLLASQLAPKSPQVLVAEAYYFQKTHQETLAEKMYQEALSVAPSDPRILNNYGAFLCHKDQVTEGLVYLKRAEKNPYYLNAENLQANIKICEALAKDNTPLPN